MATEIMALLRERDEVQSQIVKVRDRLAASNPRFEPDAELKALRAKDVALVKKIMAIPQEDLDAAWQLYEPKGG